MSIQTSSHTLFAAVPPPGATSSYTTSSRTTSPNLTTCGIGSLTQTTPFPNFLLDEVMPRLNDTQWRLLCVIVRQTLGWQREARDNTRKQWDWLTREQLKKRTGRNSEALASAVDALIRQDYIVARSGTGRQLITPLDRRQNQSRIYYGLSPSLLARLGAHSTDHGPAHLPVSESLEGAITRPPARQSSVDRYTPRKIELGNIGKSNTTKQTLTKEILTKDSFELERGEQKLTVQRGQDLTETVQRVFEKIPDSVVTDMAPKVRVFVQLFGELHAAKKEIQPDLTLSTGDWRLLNSLLEKHPNLEWKPVLEKFLDSDIGYIERHNHSLLTFVNMSNVFLMGISRRRAPRR